MKIKITTSCSLTKGAFTVPFLLSYCLSSSSLVAQAASGAEGNEERVEISKFVVSTTEDKGYLAKNTLSGTRSTARLLDVSQEIAIANRELISDLGVDAMLPAIQFVTAGINRRSFNPGDDQYIRGFRLVGSLKDGFVMGSNAVGSLYDVDRVEVIKGPAAMIFGQAASLGGLINYVSRRPTRTHQAEVKAAVGSFDYYRGEAHVSGPLTSTLRYRADVGLTDSDWSERRFGFYKDNFIGGGIEYDIGPKTMLTVDGYVTQVDYYYPTTMMDPVTNQLLAQSRDFTIDDDFAFHNTYQRRITATLVSQLSDSVQLRLFGAYNSSGNDWLRPYALGLAADNATLSRITESFITDPYFSNFQSDLLWSFDTGPLAHKFSLGGDARFTVDGYTNESFALAPINIRNPVYGAVPSTVPGSGAGGYVDYYKADVTTSSVYVQDQIDLLSGRVSLIAGARYNNFKQVSRNPRAATVVNNLQRDDKIVHRFGALYHPVRNTTIYVNNSQSFTFNFGRDTITGAPFVPSVGEVKEVGVKGEFFNGALSLSAAYFDMKLTNVRVQFTQGPNDPTPGGQGIRQTGTERNEGFEATAAISKAFGPGTINGIATVYHGDVRNAAGVTPVGPVNDTYSIFGKYEFTSEALKGFGFGAGVRGQGDWIGPNIRAGVPSSFQGYEVFNVLATYQNDRFKVQLNVDNVGDKIYVEGYELANWIFTSKGREIKLSASYRF